MMRPRVAAPARSTALKPVDVAFLGEHEVKAARGSKEPSRFVQVLCWSRTPVAWPALAQAWESIKAYREDSSPYTKIHKAPVAAPSWVQTTVPQLAAPFINNPAEESTLAAWIARAHIALVAAIVEPGAKDGDGVMYRTSLLGCLSAYQTFLKFPAYDPCQVIVTAARTTERAALLAAAFPEALDRLRGERSLTHLQLRLCAPDENPLPLALATLASAAVVRYLQSPTANNPIYEAIRSKFVAVPRPITALEGGKRR